MSNLYDDEDGDFCLQPLMRWGSDRSKKQRPRSTRRVHREAGGSPNREAVVMILMLVLADSLAIYWILDELLTDVSMAQGDFQNIHASVLRSAYQDLLDPGRSLRRLFVMYLAQRTWGTSDWIPTDQLAGILTGLTLASENGVFPAVNPAKISCLKLLPTVQEELSGVKVSSYEDWLQLLKSRAGSEVDADAVRRHPGLKLTDFYESLLQDKPSARLSSL
ncbi:cytochrome P450 monooxygenase [Fonsecaea nubica]|uniref:Cytochrome P450 monooxygenase n=1 Tax=Fonsecaea nubica TaxID=856822 RepID=A0A178C426_9EURO|nr:cytochrome P450 monooxygenase [Fonsecaea nubica]OAL23693.1 cytochrome P450 monooxygenase [Fonsecaea nubica]